METRHIKVAAVTAALIMGAGVLWSVPSHAASYYGPIEKSGQCWHSSYGVGASAVGWWGECARSAPSLFGEPTGHGPFPHNGKPGHEGGPRVGGHKLRALQGAAKG
jgi:hypothetical protein